MFYHVLPHLCHWFSQPPNYSNYSNYLRISQATWPYWAALAAASPRAAAVAAAAAPPPPRWAPRAPRGPAPEDGPLARCLVDDVDAKSCCGKKSGKTIGNHRKKMEMTMSMSLFVRILQLIYHLLLNLEADGPSWWPWCVYLETFASDLPWESRIPGAEWCHDRRHRSP